MTSASGDLRTTLTASAALTTAVLPVFLIGALSEAVGEELGFGEAAVGGAVTVLLGTAGLTATMAGRMTERVGAGVTLRLGVVIAGLGAASVGLLAQTWWHIAVPFACIGLAVGLIDTGAARTFADHVRQGRQGTAFGLKEASVPAASLMAGLALPILAVTLSWRAAFVGALGVAALVLVALPRHVLEPASTSPVGGEQAPVAGRGAVVRFAIGVGLGAGAATAGATFLVPTGLAYGLGPTVAGTTLSVASIASILARIFAGRWADDPAARPVSATTVMMGAGAGGAAVLILAGPSALVVIGAVLVLGAGWGWTGLAFLAVVRARPDAPAAAAGVVLTGLGIGGAVGPFVFGALAQAGSYPTAWAVTAAALAVSAGLAFSARSALSPSPSPTNGDAHR